MNDYQKLWVVIITPFLFIYSIYEIYRGFYILVKREYKSTIVYSIRLYILRTFVDSDAADKYLNNYLKSPGNIYPNAIISILEGISGLLVGAWWLIIFFKK